MSENRGDTVPSRMAAWYESLKRMRTFFRKTGLRPFHFVPPVVLALVAALCEGAGLALLVPVTQGVITGNFDFIQKYPLLRDVMLWVNKGQGFSGIHMDVVLLIAMVFVAMLAKNLFNYWSTLAAARRMVRFSNDLRKVIFGRLMTFGAGYFHKKSIGHLHQVLVSFVQMLAREFSEIQQCVYLGATLVIYLGIMAWISRSMTLFAVIAFPLLYLALHRLIQKLKRSSSSYSKQFMELSKKIANSLSCIPLVKACSFEPREFAWFTFASDRVADCEYRMEKKRLLVQPLQETILLLVILALVAGMAFVTVVSPSESRVAGFLVFFVVLRRAAYSFGVFNRIQAALAVMKGPITEIEEVLSDDEKYYVADGEKKLVSFKEGIEVRELSFSFASETRGILEDVCLTFPKGKSVALVGPTGSGKTTLVHLLMRLYETPASTVYLDGTDIREYNLASLHEKMALISQESYLFNASLRINLVYGLKREVSDREIEATLEQARLTELITHQAAGLDAEIGERGIKLSGGEKQRLSIARAILRRPEILILDEATSSLDAVTEKQIQEALDAVIRGRTAIIVAHRLSTIRNADKIVVLDNGRILEQGTLEELLARKGKFYELWEAQKFF